MSVQSIIRDVVTANNGKAYVPSIANPTLRAALCNLAVELGVGNLPPPDNELVTLYALARNDEGKARAMAARLANCSEPDQALWGAGQPQAPTAPATPLEYATRAELEAFGQAVGKAVDDIAHKGGLAVADALLASDFKAHVAELVAAELANRTPTVVEIVQPTGQAISMGMQHYRFPMLATMVGSARQHVYLYGPAGSGKTTAAINLARALGVPFYASAKLDSEYAVLGFVNGSGVVRTPFREAFEHGGLFLFDELDRSDPSAVVALNMALANKMATFPDALVHQHPDFYCVAGGNTTLQGASMTYTAGIQQDASSVDRFAFIEWNYDEELERAVSSNSAWCEYVQAVRATVKARGIDKLVTPRATYDGEELLAVGVDPEDVKHSVLWKGLDQHTIDAIASNCPVNYPPAQSAYALAANKGA